MMLLKIKIDYLAVDNVEPFVEFVAVDGVIAVVVGAAAAVAVAVVAVTNVKKDDEKKANN